MRVVKSRWLLAAAGAVALAAAGVPARSAETPAFPALQAIDAQSQALYKQVSGSLVRVNVVQSAVSVLDPALRMEYEKRRAGQPFLGGGGGRGRRDRGGMGGGNPSGNLGGGQGMRGGFRGGPPGGFGGRGGFGGPPGISVSGFLQDKIRTLELQQPQTDAARTEIDRLRTLQLHAALVREGIQGDMNALVLDTKGDILLLAGLIREAHTDPLTATLSGGATAKARFIGSNLYGGYTILQLDNTAGLKPIRFNNQGAVHPGQLTMNISTNSMNLSWGGGRPMGGNGDDRGGAFVFDVQGALISAMPSGAVWQPDRGSMTAARLERDINYIETGGPGGKPTDLEPRELGITFGPPISLSHATMETLGNRPGVEVTGVTPGSLAEKAGIKPGDVILSIDKHPVSDLVSPGGQRQTLEMLQLRLSFATRTGDAADVPVQVIDGDKETTLHMKLN